MKQFDNEIMLITYSDSMGHDLKDLKRILDRYFKGIIGGVHILPFFPSSGDRGFAPVDYKKVDSAFGDWEDIRALAQDHYLMYDFMINHISAQSQQFKDYIKNRNNSPYRDMFIRYKDFWEHGEPTPEELEGLYKLRVKGPVLDVTFEDGTTDKIWSTFSSEQIDIDVNSKVSKDFFEENLKFLSKHYASIIRLDAFAYSTKKRGTNCFFVEPETWEILDMCRNMVKPSGVEVLPEIHENYLIQQKVADHDHWVYDFALPMLVLHGLLAGRSDRLLNWLEICPRKQFTTLDTHDGIGVVDVRYLLEEDEIDAVKQFLADRGAGENNRYRDPKVYNRSLYQLNCTYYSALGEDDNAYLLARAIQFFTPGIPMVYYVGLLAGKNDFELMNRTQAYRDINRHYFTEEEIERTVQQPVLQRLYTIMRFRNSYHQAFDGEFKVSAASGQGGGLELTWINGDYFANLKADLKGKTFEIVYRDISSGKIMTL